MKLTKKNVYKYCYDLWSWLAETSYEKYSWYDRKRAWPEWGIIFREFKIKNHCFACEYTAQETPQEIEGVLALMNCNLCPLIELWNDGMDKNLFDPFRTPCEQFNSPYHKWRFSNISYKREEYAAEIAKFCKNKLEEEN